MKCTMVVDLSGRRRYLVNVVADVVYCSASAIFVSGSCARSCVFLVREVQKKQK